VGDVSDYWAAYKDSKHNLFQTYARALISQPHTPADIDTTAVIAAAVLATANVVGAANMRPFLVALSQTLNNFSDRVVQLAAVQIEVERVQVRVQNQADRQVVVQEPVEGGNARACTVRLQLQTNFTMKGGNDTLATETVNSADGVTVVSLDTAFAEIVRKAHMNKKLDANLHEAYAAHKNLWANYGVGGSHSINFDENGLIAGKRPSYGYRLDVENIRQAPGKRNFI
jgi:hypothetical protein